MHSISLIRQSKKGLVMTGAAQDNNDKDPPCHIVLPRRFGTTGFQSVCRAAAASLGASIQSTCSDGLNAWNAKTFSAEREALVQAVRNYEALPGLSLSRASAA